MISCLSPAFGTWRYPATQYGRLTWVYYLAVIHENTPTLVVAWCDSEFHALVVDDVRSAFIGVT